MENVVRECGGAGESRVGQVSHCREWWYKNECTTNRTKCWTMRGLQRRKIMMVKLSYWMIFFAHSLFLFGLKVQGRGPPKDLEIDPPPTRRSKKTRKTFVRF